MALECGFALAKCPRKVPSSVLLFSSGTSRTQGIWVHWRVGKLGDWRAVMRMPKGLSRMKFRREGISNSAWMARRYIVGRKSLEQQWWYGMGSCWI